MSNEMPRESDRKTLLVVDDDPACCRFVASKVHEETTLVPLVAGSLTKAASLIADPSLTIDAILTDIFFGHCDGDSSSELRDGIDLLEYAKKQRPDIGCYVLSFYSEQGEHHAKARSVPIEVSGWFPKLYYTGARNDSPWCVIEEELLGRASPSASTTPEFDVFLAHNSRQKSLVERIARDLERHGLRPWFDAWEIPPGRSFQDQIGAAIPRTGAVAVFVGVDGVGPWEDLEQKAAVSEFVRRQCPVIPVFLDVAPDQVCLPLFLREFSSVRFDKGVAYEESLASLIWGVKGGRRDR